MSDTSLSKSTESTSFSLLRLLRKQSVCYVSLQNGNSSSFSQISFKIGSYRAVNDNTFGFYYKEDDNQASKIEQDTANVNLLFCNTTNTDHVNITGVTRIFRPEDEKYKQIRESFFPSISGEENLHDRILLVHFSEIKANEESPKIRTETPRRQFGSSNHSAETRIFGLSSKKSSSESCFVYGAVLGVFVMLLFSSFNVEKK